MTSLQENSSTRVEPEVKYVLSGRPTGWRAIDKELRDFDVEKVQSCKEDIDTLLVFAGLFSAVLSAFLVAAYPNLQPASTDTMIYILERVAAQTAGYNLDLANGRVIATTILPSSPPPFQAARKDIYINILWFASLILSLVTASFGMLIKQWLREFLATEDASALARLRLRHFREPQIKAWMVYEIAGLLPVLLHISLGLFFVGLCYFTSSVHSSVGHTTIPLVVGWALCFFAATALPIFFPDCPYKMTFLNVLIVRFHRTIRRIIARWLESQSDEEEGNHLKEDWKCDEADIVKDPACDLAILISVDAIQGNDEILGTTIPEALHYTRPSPHSCDVVHLIIQLLGHRVPTIEPSERVLSYWPFRDLFPLDALRPQARDSILALLFSHLDGFDTQGCGTCSYDPMLHGIKMGVSTHHTASFCAFFLIISIHIELLQPSAISFLRRCFSDGDYLGWLCRQMVSSQHWRTRANGNDLQYHQARLMTAITKLVTHLGLTIDQGLQCLVNITFWEDSSRSPFNADSLRWEKWQWPDDRNLEYRSSCLTLLFHLVSRELDSEHLRNQPSPESLRTLGSMTNVLDFTLHEFLDFWKQIFAFDYGYTVYQSFRGTANIAFEKEDTALLLTNTLFDSFQTQPDSAESSLFDLSYMLAKSSEQQYSDLQSGSRLRLESPDIDTAITHRVLQDVMSKVERSADPNILHRLQQCQLLEFLFITIDVPPNLRHKCRELFTSLPASLRHLIGVTPFPEFEGISKNIAKAAEHCLRVMRYEGRMHGEVCPCSEEDSIFPDELLNLLIWLAGGDYCKWFPLPRVPQSDNMAIISGLPTIMETQSWSASEEIDVAHAEVSSPSSA